MKLMQIAGVSLVVASTCLLLGKERSTPVILCGYILLLLESNRDLAYLLGIADKIGRESDLQAYTKPMLKGLGIAAVCGIGGTVLKECGAQTLSKGLEWYATLKILSLAIPFAVQLIDGVRSLL